MIDLSSIATHRDAPPTYKWLFTYGTLMPGQSNYPLLQSATIHAVTNAKVRGRIGYPTPHFHGYPAAVLEPDRDSAATSNWVYGALLLVDTDHSAFKSANAMEVGARYRLTDVTAIWNDEPVAAVGWSYTDFIYDVIASGRWKP